MNQLHIESYFSGLTATLNSVREVQELYNPTLAFNFNSINFLKPNENKYSEILCFFLDPNQTHGQGPLFLTHFLQTIELENKVSSYDLKKVKCQCEHSIDHQRRIDILITFEDNQFAIAIENKIWAADQLNQLIDYNSYLKSKFGTNYCLLYLTPYQAEPTENSIDKTIFKNLESSGFLKTVGYTDHILDCVHKWVINCQSERVRVFLLDFEGYLRKEFMGEKFMEENQTIANYALKNPDNLEVAFATFNAIHQVKEKLLETFRTQINEIARRNNLLCVISDDLGLSINYQGFSFFKKDWQYGNIRFQFNSKNANSFGYGICHNGSIEDGNIPTSIPDSIANNIINKFNIHSGKQEWWLFFTYIQGTYANWSNQSQPWIDIQNGKMKKYIESVLISYLQIINDLEL